VVRLLELCERKDWREVDELALELFAPGQARDHVSSPSIKSEGKHFTNGSLNFTGQGKSCD
jgi:hypothetical protein